MLLQQLPCKLDDGILGLQGVGISYGDIIVGLYAELGALFVAVVHRTCGEADTPPACGSSALKGIDKSACKLFVPSGSLDSYKVADQWKDFFLIEEINTTGITSMQETKPESSEYTTTYDLNGRKTVGLQRGMNIVRLKNGETRKVVVK